MNPEQKKIIKFATLRPSLQEWFAHKHSITVTSARIMLSILRREPCFNILVESYITERDFLI